MWLVGQVPHDIRRQLNLPSDTKGIDGIIQTRTGTLVPYQAKFRSQRAYLTYSEVAPFLGLTERATDRIIFTNSNELAKDVKNRDAMRTVRGIDFDDLTADDFRAISGWLREATNSDPETSAASVSDRGSHKDQRNTLTDGSRPCGHGVRNRQDLGRAVGSGSAKAEDGARVGSVADPVATDARRMEPKQ